MKSLVIMMLFTGLASHPAVAAATGPVTVAQEAAKADRAATAGVVNLNTATTAQLEALPGIGPATAKRIIEYREKNGPFTKIEDVMNVKGIGEKSFLRLRPLLTTGQPPARSAPATSQP